MGGGIGKSSCDVVDVVFEIKGVVDEYERVDPDLETVGNATGSGGLEDPPPGDNFTSKK